MSTIGARNDRLLLSPEGGSLNTLEFRADVVVKSYAGTIARGYDKLFQEYTFLKVLPPALRAHFADPVFYVDRSEPRLTELHLRRIRRPAVAKAILRRLWTPDRTRRIVAEAMRILLEDLYPLRQDTLPGAAVYTQFHSPRLRSAVAGLRRLPRIRELVTATQLLVNGTECPSTEATLSWLDAEAAAHFADTHLVAAHGDSHLDNLLASADGPPAVTFVDPRGDPVLPPHYDYAKLLKASRTGYDLVHYGLYDISVSIEQATVRVDFALDHVYDDHFGTVLDLLEDAVPEYAAAEHVTLAAFRTAVAIAELVHVISFAYYHANHPHGLDVDRVRAYLATAALLARRLMTRGLSSEPVLIEPLAL